MILENAGIESIGRSAWTEIGDDLRMMKHQTRRKKKKKRNRKRRGVR
jgi:hypothetical protein